MSVLKEPNEVEINGMIAGGDAGGVYLDSIGKSDIAELTYDQWMCFVETIIRGYELHCAKIWEHEIPY